MFVKLKDSSLGNLSRVYSQLKESSGGSKPVRLRETTQVISKRPQVMTVKKNHNNNCDNLKLTKISDSNVCLYLSSH